jgi:hypothetical protein
MAEDYNKELVRRIGGGKPPTSAEVLPFVTAPPGPAATVAFAKLLATSCG